jgi:glucokinase
MNQQKLDTKKRLKNISPGFGENGKKEILEKLKMRNAISIDLGGTNLKSGILLESGKMMHLDYSPSDAKKGSKKVIENIRQSIEKLLEKKEAKEAVGIGIGSPGQVDYKNGIVYDPPNFCGWHSENLAQMFNKHFHLPVFVDNDANVAALAESVFGSGKKSKYFALITLGTGVGCGFILDNKVYHGSTGAAGEFGHTVIKYDGPVCNCGQRGCLERFIGAQWIVERALNRLKSYPESKLHNLVNSGNVSPKVIADLANNGDDLCKKIITDTGDFLGMALGSLVNLLNLDLILIGGGISNAGDILFDAIRKTIINYSLSITGSIVRIEKASLGEAAGVIGAGQLVFENLANPI